MVYNGYYKVMSNIPKMGQLPTPDTGGICYVSSLTTCTGSLEAPTLLPLPGLWQLRDAVPKSVGDDDLGVILCMASWKTGQFQYLCWIE